MEKGCDIVRSVPIERITPERLERLDDLAAVEEPLGVFLQYWYKQARRTEPLTVTMRTPGHDRELACGYLYSEGVICSRSDIRDIRYLGAESLNEILIEVEPEIEVEAWRMQRTGYLHSSCGICGKRTLDSLQELNRIERNDFTFPPESIYRFPEALRTRQSGFMQTGGLHAAAIADPAGQIAAVFEDLGRHNALDKLIGSCLLSERLPLSRCLLFLSSRASFELVQKAAAAGAPVLATVGSPSTLAIEAAERAGLTLIGFVRADRFNVYSGFERLAAPLHS